VEAWPSSPPQPHPAALQVRQALVRSYAAGDSCAQWVVLRCLVAALPSWPALGDGLDPRPFYLRHSDPLSLKEEKLALLADLGRRGYTQQVGGCGECCRALQGGYLGLLSSLCKGLLGRWLGPGVLRKLCPQAVASTAIACCQ
jgi:hypothetical protein